MAGIPDNIVAILGTDNAGNVVSIESSIFRAFETTVVQSVSAVTPVTQTVEKPRTTQPVPVVTPTFEPLIFTADPNYIPQVNSTKDNLINSILYQRGLKIGLNTVSPQFTFDAIGGSINITPLEQKDGYRINRYLMAWQDITKYTLYLGDSTFLKIVDVNSLLISGLALVTSPTTPRVLSIDDTGLVSTLSLTSGSVIFSNGVGLVQDNAAFFWDATNKRLGIGNKVPTEALHVTGSIRQSAVTTAMLKADSTGKIVAAVAGTDYLTTISGIAAGGELLGTYPNPTLVNSAVTGKLLTGVTTLSGTVNADDTILSAFGKIQSQLSALSGSLIYKGSWNASTNTPTLVSGTGITGNYYIVSVAGTTTIDGVSSWAVGDWIVFNGTTSKWEKIATQSVTSVNGHTGVVTLITDDVQESGTPTNKYYTNARAIGSVLTGYVSGAGTISAADTILGAIQKLNGNISALVTGVSSVTGTTNRITASPTTGAVVVDIASTYVGQASITTVGTITTGTWQGTAIANAYVTGSANWNTAFGWGNHASAGYALSSALSGYQPLDADLTAIAALATTGYLKRTGTNTWILDTTVGTGTVTSVSALTIGTTGTDITSSVATPTTTPVITLNIPTASAANRGALSAADWTTFNSKQAALGYVPANSATTITINGTTLSLAANRSWSVGTVTDVAALTIVSTGVDITSTVATGTTTPVITLSIPTASASARGALSSTDWTTFNNKQAYLGGTGLVRSTAGSISYDTATYYLASNPSGYISGNQSITLSGDVSGTGTTAITTTLATITQAATGNFVKVTLDTKGRVTGNTAVTASDITTALTYTPVTNARTLTINGTTYDLTANRSWTIDIGSNVRNVVKYTATAGQTTFTVTGGYTVGVIDVYLNGAKLTGTDYTASNGTTVVLAAGVVAGDIIETVAYTSYAASSISGAGTTGYLTKWTGSSSQGNSIIQDSGSAITVGGSVAATSFSGAGTGLTGTASGLSIGGSAASITGIYGGSITSLQVTNGLGYTPYNATNPSGYITGITSVMVTTALGYTPYNSSNPSGYITGITSGNVITALGYTPYNATNPNGYITGITSGNVTTALGYTPYNATNPAGYITSSASITGTSSNITAYTINQNVGTSNSPTFAGQTINAGGQLIRSSSSNTGGSRTINHCKVASTTSPIYAIQVTGLTSKLINWVCYFGSNDAYLGYSAYQIIAAGIVWFNSSGVAFDQGSNWTYQAGSGNNGTLQYTFNPSGYANSLVFGSGNSTGAGGLTTSYHIVFYGDGVNSMTINYL